ncbi:Autophagy-related protein 13 [Tolypocladium paradoxum]|uniref:Autophagy-related protein 13 n=1 Tax=Tolypocladium paradoxum TaxID=94208 RepID=A0A2S4KRT2_9HYPO|nr:Autophagy-related protein 13 [Tolypocladium paradoxum]
MHQQARAPPRLSSPASSPQTNQTRTNNPRDAALGARQRAGSNVSGRDPIGSPTTDSLPSLGPPAESIKKLDQIVQNFYTKAAVLILDSRMKVKITRNANGMRKTNKWYQIATDEIDDFRDELKVWKTCGSLDNLPPPMVIEVYLDTSLLKESQSLVVIDDDGKRWDVMEQLNASGSSSGSNSPGLAAKNAEVVLERWRVELKTNGNNPSEDFGPTLPTIYKKAIVFFRTLYTASRLLPAWKFASSGAAKSSHPALTPRCRIRMSEPPRSSPDPLRQSIDGRADPVTEYMFGDLDVPVGRLGASVAYRNDCSFRIDDSESLLSSRFMGVDENFFKPSLPQHGDRQREPVAEVGSLRGHRRGTSLREMNQTYGSLSTFHGDGPLGTSPISALRAVKHPGSDTSSPPASFPALSGLDAPNSLPIRPSSSRAPVRAGDGPGRRTSVSFQPFKAGSLSASPIPRTLDSESPASTHSLSRPVGFPAGSQPRNRSSLTAGMPASLRGGPPAAAPETPVVGSPRPASTGRYSSSFTHRRGRLSVGGASKAGDEEQSSSGRQSLASSVAQPGSGLLAEAGPASSGSLHAEEDDISDFLKALDSKKTLKSFEPAKRGESATNRTVAQLSKFHMMRDSNNALGESMTSSMQMHRSSSSSSRQLTSVPGMVAPASASTSTSPGKPVSPHTPHTPAIPSRLSENSIIDYSTTERIASRGGRPQRPTVPGPSRESTITQEGTTAIDIPLSPRLGSYQRRSSSVAQQSRAMIDDDDTDLAFAAHRSISLGADDREPPTMSTLLGRQTQLERSSTARDSLPTGLQPAAEIQPSDSSEVMQRGSAEDNPPDGLIPSVQPSSPFPRRRYAGLGAGAAKPTPQSSRGSFTGSLSRLGRADDESVSEEPLVFDLSEMDAQGRRSTEEGRGGGNASADRGAFEPRGTTRRGWS